MVDQPPTKTGSIHQADGESGETDSKVQKEVESFPLTYRSWIFPLTYKYWTALTHTELKLFEFMFQYFWSSQKPSPFVILRGV